MQRTQIFLWALVALGCSGRSIDVGPGGSSAGAVATGAGTSGTTGAGGTTGASTDGYSALPPSDCTDTTPLPSWPAPNACDAASAATDAGASLVGTWNGYVENGQPPWDKLTLTINGASVDGGVCGTLIVGAGPAPAPATDPNMGYPPGGDQTGYGGAPAISVSGATLTLLKGTTDGVRVQFSVAQSEAWRSWCQLQSSFNDGSLSCGCLPQYSSGMGSTSASGKCTIASASSTLTVNCGKVQLCGQTQPVCACNASGCDASTAETADFDLRFTADMGEGSNTSNPAARTIFTRAN